MIQVKRNWNTHLKLRGSPEREWPSRSERCLGVGMKSNFPKRRWIRFSKPLKHTAPIVVLSQLIISEWFLNIFSWLFEIEKTSIGLVTWSNVGLFCVLYSQPIWDCSTRITSRELLSMYPKTLHKIARELSERLVSSMKGSAAQLQMGCGWAGGFTGCSACSQNSETGPLVNVALDTSNALLREG